MGRRNSRPVALALVAFLLVPSAGAEPAAQKPEEGAEAQGPGLLLRGVDLRIPAQDAFRDWPAAELVERPYWLPWAWPSFKRASLFGRPVFFALTVNWSRASRQFVEETLADPRILRLLNDRYVMIQTHADLRPDIRERYQTGAWPMVAFLLPDGNPIVSQANDLGVARPITTTNVDAETLLFLVEQGAIYWDRRSDQLMEIGRQWRGQEGEGEPRTGEVAPPASDMMARWLLANADRKDGGFGLAPKFVVPGLEEYGALRASRGFPEVEGHARRTLERIVESPLYDPREGGVHRLAAAPAYGEIQYEKLLETNAALVRELVIALRTAEDPSLGDALRSTAEFIVQVLGRAGGGFYHAQVADPASVDGGAWWTTRERESLDPPPVDPLVLSGSNALAGAALLRAGALLSEARFTRAGAAALDLVQREALTAGRGVRHSIEPRDASGLYLVAQADTALGFVDAYETTGNRSYLEAAREIADFTLLNLSDPGETTFRDSLGEALPIGLLANVRRPLRPNVRLARVMLRLSHFGLGQSYRERALAILHTHSGDLSVFLVHGTEAALAIEEAIAEPLRIRLAGARESEEARALRRAAVNLPWAWTLVGESAAPGAADGPASAELTWQGRTRRVEGAAQLRALVLELIERVEPGPGR